MSTKDTAISLGLLAAGGVAIAAASGVYGKGSAAKAHITLDEVRAGDRVTILDRFGNKKSGRVVMRSAHGGWVLNMGGKYGTPGLVDDSNFVSATRAKGSMTRDGSYEATLMYDADEDDPAEIARRSLQSNPYVPQSRPLTAEPQRITSAQGSPARKSSAWRIKKVDELPSIPGPSLKTLEDSFKVNSEQAYMIKYYMKAGFREEALNFADGVLGGNGIEYIASEQDTMRSREGIEYVNMGDTYDTTLIYDYKTGRFYVGAWGDWVERYPKRFGY